MSFVELPLPLFARIVVERVQQDDSLRTPGVVDALLDDYARSCATHCDTHTRLRVHGMCER